MPFSSFRRVEWAGVLAALLFSVSGWATFRAYADAAAWVRHTADVRREVAGGRDALLAAQLGQRGYLLTGRDKYLDPYHAGADAFGRHLARAGGLSADSPTQLGRLAAAGREGEALLAELEATIARVRAGDKPGAYSVVLTDFGETQRRQCLAALDACVAEEDRLLEERAGRAEWLFRACLTATALAGAAVALAGLFAWRAYRRRAGPGDW